MVEAADADNQPSFVRLRRSRAVPTRDPRPRNAPDHAAGRGLWP